MTYFVANRGERTERVIDPLAVVGDRGHWYLQAVDHTVGEERWFRVDRIEALRETGDPVTTGRPGQRGPGLAGPVPRTRWSLGSGSRPMGPG